MDDIREECKEVAQESKSEQAKAKRSYAAVVAGESFKDASSDNGPLLVVSASDSYSEARSLNSGDQQKGAISEETQKATSEQSGASRQRISGTAGLRKKSFRDPNLTCLVLAFETYVV